jgi:hypothetical protein
MKLLSIFSFLSLFNGLVSQSPECSSDTNNDNLIDVTDLLNVLSSFSTEDIESDVNNDLIVDVNDLLQVLGDFGEECIVGEPLCCNDNCNLGNDCGGQLWTECGTSCPLVCGQPEPMMCNMMCNIGYQCPSNMWWCPINHECVDECIDDCERLIPIEPLPEDPLPNDPLPPDIAIGRPYIDNNNIKSVKIFELNDWSRLIE